jgi:voltage-gated potassium channel Kch
MDERERRWERRFEWPLVTAALLTIPALVMEESSDRRRGRRAVAAVPSRGPAVGAVPAGLPRSPALSRAIPAAHTGVWFAVETVTTVGYGDIVPTTSAGRVVAMIIMFVGIGFVALLTGFVADRFVNRERRAEAKDQRGEILRELRAISERLDRLERGGAGD